MAKMSAKNKQTQQQSRLTKLSMIRKPKGDDFRPSNESIQEAQAALYTEQDVRDTFCGIGSFKPKWLQHMARKEIYLLVLGVAGLAQGMFFTYTVSVISTIEKRFKITSKQIGVVLVGEDISQAILAMLLSYVGNYGHRPRWMSLGVFSSAVGAFLAALPHFVYGPGEDAIRIVESLSGGFRDADVNLTVGTLPGKAVELCHMDMQDECEDGSGEDRASLLPLIFLFLSQFLLGILYSLLASIGVTYMDDNVSKKSYPLFYVSALMVRIMGPILGFIMGGKCLSIWIDPAHSPNLVPRDPRWLGAWWIGFVVIAVTMSSVGGAFLLFPRNLPGSLRREAKRVVRQANRDKEEYGGQGRGIHYFASLARTKMITAEPPSLKNLGLAMKRLFTNKIWVGNLFNTVTTVLALSGFWNFSSKYIEYHFRKSAAESNYIAGTAGFIAMVVGTGIGGAVLRWGRPRPRYVAGYNIFVTLFVALSFFALIFLGCPKLHVIGPLEGSEVPDCSSGCGCSERYSPMCSQDNTTLFYSPCYAGCTAVNSSVSPVMYSGCKCIEDSNTVSSFAQHDRSSTSKAETSLQAGGWGVSGYCPDDCPNFYTYLIIMITFNGVMATGRGGSSLLHLRSVQDIDKGLALGTLTVFMSLFGFIPAPIIMGAVIDSACLAWDRSCGLTGNCWIYDTDKLRTLLHLVPGVLTLISVLGDFVVFKYAHQMDLYGEEEEMELQKIQAGSGEEAQPLSTQQEERC